MFNVVIIAKRVKKMNSIAVQYTFISNFLGLILCLMKSEKKSILLLVDARWLSESNLPHNRCAILSAIDSTTGFDVAY